MKFNWKVLAARFALLSFCLILCLAVLEIATRVMYAGNKMHYGIEMWKYAKELKRSSENYDIGHEHVPNREAFLMGVPVKINSMGLRDREFTLDKPNDVVRILVLGDSLTFGWGAHQDKTYPKVLERKLNENLPAGLKKVEVINTGVGNYNTSQEVAYYENRGRLFHPDIVLVGISINDAEPTPRENRDWLARESYLYVFVTSALDGIMREFGSRPRYQDYYLNLYKDDQPAWIACQDAFKKLIRTCKEDHTQLVLLVLPELHKVGANYEFQSVTDKFVALGKAANVPVIDMMPSVAKEDPATLWVTVPDPHPNDKACECYANYLADKLPSIVNLPDARSASNATPAEHRSAD